MLYDKDKKQPFGESLFRNPTAAYRGTPFWAWNDEIEVEECVRQAHIFRDMGFGGYHIHPRAGLATPYFGEKYFSCVKAMVADAKANEMLTWLYDEDRYPSGFAGGAVTKDGRFRRRSLVFTTAKRKENATFSGGRQTGGARLLATYAVRLFMGLCKGYTRLDKGEKGRGVRFYAYLVVDEPTDEFNEAGYVDVLSEAAIDAFADYTYGGYQKAVGEAFRCVLPAIFTDEPQMKKISYFRHPLFPREATIPWTDDFTESYQQTFGVDLLDRLPELFFDFDSPTVYRTRYTYHTHRTERFARAFSDNLGERTAALGIALTGHLMEEPTLETQAKAVGETMRHYKEFGLPGIDMLCGRHEYTTAKQAASVVRQEGKEGMLCELYGVSRWAAEFGKFKEEGDWLACLGVTIRVPHLSYYSMRGEAKRDYPPSISYQSPWFLKYKAIEDHFARLNTALTRGKAINHVAVIHPIESYFLYMTSQKPSRKIAEKRNEDFLSLTDWLLFGGFDFDFISEALLPSQRRENALAVGQCEYHSVLVPDLVSIRRSTLDFLIAFRKAGGNVLFLGEIPSLIEGEKSDEARRFAEKCAVLPFDRESVLSSLEEDREVYISSEKKPNAYLATVREEDGGKWVFTTSPRQEFPYPRSVTLTNDPNVVEDCVRVGIKGEYFAREFDTATGEIRAIPTETENGITYVRKTLYNNDGWLVRFEKTGENVLPARLPERDDARVIPISDGLKYVLDEPNVLLLDKAKWSIGGDFFPRLDLDLITPKARKSLGLPAYRNDLQPWLYKDRGEKKPLTLRFEIPSDADFSARFACEYEEFSLFVNGERITAPSDGFYTDKSIRTTPISLKSGSNVIDLTVPMDAYNCLENCYLLGAFGVDLKGTKARLTALPERLKLGDVTKQSLPFYGGKITYFTSFEANGEKAEIFARYASALLTVRVNDEEKDIMFAPYTATFKTNQGENRLAITAYVSRENAFGAVHIRRKYKRSDSPSWFHKKTLPARVPSYVLDPGGVLKARIALFRDDDRV